MFCQVIKALDNTGELPLCVCLTQDCAGRFPCGRWLGRGVDDDSTERLLVGELVPRSMDSDELVETCRTPPARCHSPSVPRRSQDARPSMEEIQHMLGKAMNICVCNSQVQLFYGLLTAS